MSENQIALLNYIRNINAKTLEWVAADPRRFACTLVEDLAHWAESGIHTVEDFIKYDLATEIYDSTKAAYGFRPSFGALMNCTIEELEKEAKSLREEVKHQLESSDREIAFQLEEDGFEEWLSAGMEDHFADLAEAAGY